MDFFYFITIKQIIKINPFLGENTEETHKDPSYEKRNQRKTKIK